MTLLAALGLHLPQKGLGAEIRPSDAERLGIPVGIVAERRAQLEALMRGHVASAKTQTEVGVARLEGALRSFIAEPVQLVAAINASLQDSLDQVQAQLNAALSEGASDRVLQTIQHWRASLTGDKRFVELRKAAPMLGIDPAVDARFEELFERVTGDLAGTTG